MSLALLARRHCVGYASSAVPSLQSHISGIKQLNTLKPLWQKQVFSEQKPATNRFNQLSSLKSCTLFSKKISFCAVRLFSNLPKPTDRCLGKWKDRENILSLYLSSEKTSFFACVQNPKGELQHFSSDRIKYGIGGALSHQDLFQKTGQVAQDHIAAFVYPSEGTPEEIWIFKAPKAIVPLIKQAKESLKQNQNGKFIESTEKALKLFETALKIEVSQKGDITELNSVIMRLKQELFLLQIQQETKHYLSSEQAKELNAILELYQGQDDLFSCLSAYLEAFESSLKPHLQYLTALLNEHYKKDPIAALPHYLELAEKSPNPLHCLKKAESLVKAASDPLAMPHFLERLDHKLLVKLSEEIEDPALQRWLLHKDAIRMAFEGCLIELNIRSRQAEAPTCFICFNVEEADVGRWTEHVLVPDLDRCGIKPIFCFRDLGPGKELNAFQGLIRGADQVIILCTPGLKLKCDARKKAPTGVAQEIRLAQERYNDAGKWETNFPIYLKGDRKSSCPSVFFEPILGTKFTSLDKSSESSLFSYYASAFELFGGMRGIPREFSRQLKDEFLTKANQILKGEIDKAALDEWRSARLLKNKHVLITVQERVSKLTQLLNLPFFPKDFVGREKELRTLHEKCMHRHRVAITGLGGIGKTALTLKYGNDYQSHYQFIHFIPASNEQLIKDGLLNLADDLHIPQTDKIDERLHWLKTTLDRFEKEYLLIFDGIDDVEAFNALKAYLPGRGRSLLLTSRMPEQARHLGCELLELGLLSLEDSTDYLLLATGSKDKESAKVLAELLGRLPLALTHAAGYIRSRHFSIQTYLEEFKKCKVQLFKSKYLTLDEHEKTILTTWNISIESIATFHNCPFAKRVLEFFAFLGNAPVPLDLIEEWFNFFTSRKANPELHQALRYLGDYSMITGDQDTYQVHALVQSVTEEQMSQEDQMKTFEEALSTVINRMSLFIQDNVETWVPAKLCIPHARAMYERLNLLTHTSLEKQRLLTSALANIYLIFGNASDSLEMARSSLNFAEKWHEKKPDCKDSTQAIAISYHLIGAALQVLGNAQGSHEYNRKMLEILLPLYGEKDPNVATCYSSIGIALRSLGKVQEAFDFLQKALEIDLSLHGEKHPSVANCYCNIGDALQDLGKAQEAHDFYLKGLEIKLSLYDEKHPGVATCYNDIGAALQNLGKAQEAHDFFQKALEIWLSLYDEKHPEVATCYNNVGSALQNLGKAQDAYDSYLKALEIRLSLYGEKHPAVATYYHNIGTVLEDLGKAQEGHDFLQKALEILLSLYGEKHPGVAMSYNNIGSALRSLGKVQEAHDFYTKALEIRLSLYSEKHPDVATCYNNIGTALQYLGKAHEAHDFHVKALEIQFSLYGEKHPAVATCYNNIGTALTDLGKAQEAHGLYLKALEILLPLYGEKHSDVAMSYNNIGAALQSLEKAQEAHDFYLKALKIQLSLYGEKHPDVAACCSYIGAALQNLGKAQEAHDFHVKALEIWFSLYGEKHPNVATCCSYIGDALRSLGKAQEAHDFYVKALEVRLFLYGEKHPDVAACYNNIGTALQYLGKAQEAHDFHVKALDIQLSLYGEKHSDVAACYSNIGSALRSLGKVQEAHDFYVKALEVRLFLYDEKHPDVAACYNNIGTALQYLGKAQEAHDSYEKALEINLSLYGEKHPDVTICYNSMGTVLIDLGKTHEAYGFLKKALETQLFLYGEKHPEVATCYNSIGNALHSLGKAQEAYDFFQKALEIWLSHYEEKHPNVATCFNNIGIVLKDLGKAQEAYDFLQKALEINLSLYGEKHPEVAISYNNIGDALKDLGKAQEAHNSLQKALEILHSLYGEKHPDVAACYNNIGNALLDLGKAQEAYDFFQKALEIRLSLFGEKHPYVAVSYNNVGFSLQSLGKAQEAYDFFQKALEIRLSLFGEKHPYVAVSYNNVGYALQSVRKAQKAHDFFQKALEIWHSLYGEKDLNVAASYNNIGDALKDLGKAEEAHDFFKKTLKILISLCGKKHPDVATCYNNIGTTLVDLGKVQEAHDSYVKGLEILLSLHGEKHPDVTTCYNNIGTALRRLGKIQESLEFYQKALKILLSLYGEKHSDVAICYNNIGIALSDLGKAQEAHGFITKAREIYQNLQGEKHPIVSKDSSNKKAQET